MKLWKRVKKPLFIVFLSLLGVLALYVLFNQIDARKPADGFTIADLKPASFDYDNGFYDLWLLALPADKNPADPAERQKIRALFDPAFDTAYNMAEFSRLHQKVDRAQYLKQAFGKNSQPIYPAAKVALDQWFGFFRAHRQQILTNTEACSVAFERYQTLLSRQQCADFSIPCFETPIPDLLILLRLSQLYIGRNLVDACAGNWHGAVENLLQQLAFGKRAISGSRVLITNLIVKAICHDTLKALVAVMNERDCPAEIYPLIFNHLPPLEYAEFGSANCFIAEYLATCTVFQNKDNLAIYGESHAIWVSLFAKLLMQPNRTLTYILQHNRTLCELEKRPPHTWPKDPLSASANLRQQTLWWLQNPVGKALYMPTNESFMIVLYKSYRLKVRYDLARLIAECHMKFAPGQTVADLLPELTSYKELDPFSGQPYRYNESKQVLYSVGPDGMDQDGIEDAKNFTHDSDIAAPCLLYIKPALH